MKYSDVKSSTNGSSRKSPWYLFLLCTLFVASCTPKSKLYQAQPAAGTSQISTALNINKLKAASDSLADLNVKSGDVPGLSVAIAKNGEIIFSKGYGLADVDAGVAATNSTVYGITSITKQFAAATALHLAEKGKISLDDPVTKYLPDFTTHSKTLKIRHLLNHTSGTPSMRNTSSQPDKDWFSKDLTYQEMIERFGKEPFEFEPGQQHTYNNFAYYLLGEIIGRVTGTPWSEYLEKELLLPLNLKNTRGGDAKRPGPNSAKTYLVSDTRKVVAPLVSKFVLGASGDLFSSAEDLARWSHYLHSGKVLSPASVKQMTAPTLLPGGETVNYGYGLYLGQLGTHQKFYHGGARPWGGYVAYYPATGISIAVLTNNAITGREKAEEMESALAHIALGIQMNSKALSSEEMARYEGTYTLQAGTRTLDMKIFKENGQLMAQAPGQRSSDLHYHGNHYFSLGLDPNIKLSFNIKNGQADSMVLYQNGREIPGKRKM